MPAEEKNCTKCNKDRFKHKFYSGQMFLSCQILELRPQFGHSKQNWYAFMFQLACGKEKQASQGEENGSLSRYWKMGIWMILHDWVLNSDKGHNLGNFMSYCFHQITNTCLKDFF